MQYFITGIAGFLGSALANRLSGEGHNVRGLDDLSTSQPNALSPEIEFHQGDINDRPKLWTLLKNVDCVYHLAAKVSVPESILYPREYNHINVGGTVTLMEAMRDVGVGRVVFISSGAIYGKQDVQTLKESTLPNPHSPYAVSKLAAEYYIRTIGNLYGIETVCLRVFNAYGPKQPLPSVHAPVIPNFLRQSFLNGTLVIHGDGLQSRDYVYLDDVVNAMTAASTASDINHQIINVGSGTATNVKDLARMAVEITGGEPEIVYNKKANLGPDQMRADLTLAKEVLNYQPLVSLEKGLKLTFEQDEQLHSTPQNETV
ncbi:MAG: NAD-dependent epimerase/dehydratase family protein [Anaerolineaceae bacterium]|nr:NAD-dependent epimerase/dehydratase family protein [Anaerolineaceae bacterium]